MSKLYSGMSDIMATHNNNITEFNAEINELLQKLQSRGKNADDLDLTPQLLVTYMACGTSDTPFYRYIEGLDNKNNDGDILLTTKMLMDKAEVKYEELLDKTKFETKFAKGLQDKGDDIVALKAELAALKKGSNMRNGRRSGRSLPDWITNRPTDGTLTKEVNGKMYNWCEILAKIIPRSGQCTSRKSAQASRPATPLRPKAMDYHDAGCSPSRQ
jgi:hypothetical protein